MWTCTSLMLKTRVLRCWISQIQPASVTVRKHKRSGSATLPCNVPTPMHPACVVSNIWYKNKLSAIFLCILWGYSGHSRTKALAYPNTRRGIQVKYKQPLVAQSEVTFIRRHLTPTFHRLPLALQGRAFQISGLLHDTTSKCWLYTRVSYTLTFNQNK